MPISYKTSLTAWRKRRDRIHSLYKQGLTNTEIGRKLRISRQRVGQIVGKNGA